MPSRVDSLSLLRDVICYLPLFISFLEWLRTEKQKLLEKLSSRAGGNQYNK